MNDLSGDSAKKNKILWYNITAKRQSAVNFTKRWNPQIYLQQLWLGQPNTAILANVFMGNTLAQCQPACQVHYG